MLSRLKNQQLFLDSSQRGGHGKLLPPKLECDKKKGLETYPTQRLPGRTGCLNQCWVRKRECSRSFHAVTAESYNSWGTQSWGTPQQLWDSLPGAHPQSHSKYQWKTSGGFQQGEGKWSLSEILQSALFSTRSPALSESYLRRASTAGFHQSLKDAGKGHNHLQVALSSFPCESHSLETEAVYIKLRDIFCGIAKTANELEKKRTFLLYG